MQLNPYIIPIQHLCIDAGECGLLGSGLEIIDVALNQEFVQCELQSKLLVSPLITHVVIPVLLNMRLGSIVAVFFLLGRPMPRPRSEGAYTPS